ncbi:MAG: hypothetical protein H6774_03115 [Pseudomonadales bacterium]|nr:hypothetical protein [Candidatus Woesebacteria bacterium]MCB9802054.1 hypothetical protein [Pseudomonadales bacterium]
MTDDTTQQLDTGETLDSLESGADLAAKALGTSTTKVLGDGDDELQESDDIAQTLTSLQNVIERNALQLERIKQETKEKRESLKSVYENDAQLSEAQVEAEAMSSKVKERRSTLKSSPQVTTLSNDIAGLNEQKKEIEEALNNHLLNYYTLTNSTSFDTSEGDQWDFKVSAKLKAKPRG